MKHGIARIGVLVLLAATAAGAAQAATLDDLELRDLWRGESWTKESLKDRTVVVEFWGLN